MSAPADKPSPRHARAGAAPPAATDASLQSFFGVFVYSRRALALVWTTNARLTLAIAIFTGLAGVLPAAVAWVGARIVDAVVAAVAGTHDPAEALRYVVIEGVLVAAVAGAQRMLSLCQSLLRAQLGQRVNVMILEKALTLDLAHFEDADFYDKLTRARREASSRPLSLVMRTFGLAQNAVSIVSFAVLLAQFSPWAVLVLILAGLPAFDAEAGFKDVFVGAIGRLDLSDRWTLRASVRYARLIGDAADSPVIETVDQWTAGVGLTYRFGLPY